MSSHRGSKSYERRLRWNPELVHDNGGPSRHGLSKSWNPRKSSPITGERRGRQSVVEDEGPPYAVRLSSMYPTNNINGIILRNPLPIQSVRPFGVYQTHKDAMRSLRSLHQNAADAAREVTDIDDEDSPDEDQPITANGQRAEDDHDLDNREANGSIQNGPTGTKLQRHIQARKHMTEVRFAVERLSGFVGKKRSSLFQKTVGKVCHVINSVFDARTDIKLPFRLHRLQYNGFYEIHGVRAIEMYMLPSTMDATPLEATYDKENPLYAEIFVEEQLPGLEHFCVRNKATNRKRLSSCKLMVFLTHFINMTMKKRYDSRGRPRNGKLPTPHGAFIFNTTANETCPSLRIKFPNDTYSYEIALTLALNITNSFPSTEIKSEDDDWPASSVLNSVREQGVHLLAKGGDGQDVHRWTISFLKARRKLLQLTDTTGNKLRLLLALQALRETHLSRPKLLLPVHLTTVLFWASVQFPSEDDWQDKWLAHRFLDLVTALRRCMLRRILWDFFVPSMNHFEHEEREALVELAAKIKQVIVEPLRYA